MKLLSYRNPYLFIIMVFLLGYLMACQKSSAWPSLQPAASQTEGGPGSSSLLINPGQTSGREPSQTSAPAGSTDPSSSTQTEASLQATTNTGSSSVQTSSQTTASSSSTTQTTSTARPAPSVSSQPAPAKTTSSQVQTQTRPPAASSSAQTTNSKAQPGTTTKPAPSARPTTAARPVASTTQTTTTARPQTTTRQPGQLDYRQEMRDFVIRLSSSAKSRSTGFFVIVQNGEDIIKEGQQLQKDYLSAVDGIGREDFLYGASRDDVATSARETAYIKNYLDQFLAYGNPVLITDYSSTPAKMLDSYQKNKSYNYISFAADQRELNSIPAYPQPIYAENSNSVSSLAAAQNFLYLINPEKYKNKTDFLAAIAKTNYDLVIIDLFYGGSALSKTDLAQLKQKNNGGKRLAIAYMSIGEAEDYRYYWQKEWRSTPPAWLGQVNPDWPGNYLVKYWDPAWQSIIIDKSDSYLNRIINAGFDGVYLDLIDAYEYYMR